MNHVNGLSSKLLVQCFGIPKTQYNTWYYESQAYLMY